LRAQSYDAAIIGGGIIGAACARELARARLHVALIEEHAVGIGATSAGMGHLVVLDRPQPQLALSKYSLELWRELAQELPSGCDYRQCGTFWIAADEAELEIARAKCADYNRAGVDAELLDSRQLATREPNLRPDLRGALLVPGDAALQPPVAAKFLAEASGSEVIAGRATHIDGGEVRLEGGGTIAAGAVLIATGADAAELLPGLPVRARKGHILVADPGPGFAQHQVAELGYVKSTHVAQDDAIAFNVRQNPNGELLIGSSRQFNHDPRVEAAVIDRILARAIEYMPALAHARQLRTWAGFRAATPDGLPLIGRVLNYANVYVATGHEGLGVTNSLGTARLIADQILGRASEIDPAPYDPSRFQNATM
jgi:D-hydroxyproline dehydrogenase subunit beta